MIGWIPAIIWALASTGGYHADKRTDRIVEAIKDGNERGHATPTVGSAVRTSYQEPRYSQESAKAADAILGAQVTYGPDRSSTMQSGIPSPGTTTTETRDTTGENPQRIHPAWAVLPIVGVIALLVSLPDHVQKWKLMMSELKASWHSLWAEKSPAVPPAATVAISQNNVIEKNTNIGAIDVPEPSLGTGSPPISNQTPTDHSAYVTKLRWNFYGSGMYMVVDGNERNVFYETPREGLSSLGITKDSILFKGELQGSSLVGQIAAYASHCPMIMYAARGEFIDNVSRFFLQGKRPSRDDSCKITGWKDVRLIFEFVGWQEGAENYVPASGESTPGSSLETGLSVAVPTAPQIEIKERWNLNGSLMKLESNGISRRFLYTQPRQGLIEEGVTPGTTEFIGTQTGNQYDGTAYVFNRVCGAIGFPMSGAVAADEQSITMTGWVPYIDPQCRRVGGHPTMNVYKLSD